MMKSVKYIILLLVVSQISCGVTQTLSSSDIKIMTTKQYEAAYDMVFLASVSLLQSEGFLVNNADKETGIINASKQVDNEKAALTKLFLGTAQEASTSQVSFFIQPLNETLTEVKLTIYEGGVYSTESSYGTWHSTSKNSMVKDANVYGMWFNNLRAEIERRKALLE